MRQIVLDTETTGLDPKDGHRIIEIGCVELINRRLTGNDFHQYLQPDRAVDEGAVEVHGITNEFLADKPRMQDIANTFLDYVRGAELIIHNAPFDVGFINRELQLLGSDWGNLEDIAQVTDSLVMAREMHPGQRNSLDALCKRYEVDNSSREYHGALLDARILAEVYLAMTGGQATLMLDEEEQADLGGGDELHRPIIKTQALQVITPDEAELAEHEQMLEMLTAAAGRTIRW